MVRRHAFAITLSLSVAVGLFPGVSVPAEPRPQTDGPRVALSGTGQSRTPLADGQWLLLAGQGSTGPVSAACLFDPSSDTTIALPARLTEARAWTLRYDGAGALTSATDRWRSRPLWS
jgi:YD repeat-containing protein